ncbi:MAG TPA: CHAT domain-containing tetratricopeptide repeat protein [Candidatus Polarisedimenticolia bacterium]|nr:CHAT domain-containing tetratricopeptide repeat protein [Candidatus Polarisedimenticolia bacterium]
MLGREFRCGLLGVALLIQPALAGGDPLAKLRRLVEDGSYAQAEIQARRYVAQQQEAGRGESKEVAEATLLLVESLWRGGKEKDPETRRLAEHSVEMCRRLYGEEDENYAWSVASLAVVLRRTDDLEGAKTLLRSALAIREKIFGPRSMKVALTLNTLAIPEGMSGNFREARALMERALSICDDLGPRDVFAANILDNLGALCETTGDFAGARIYFAQVLEMRRKELPPDHPLTAQSALALAVVSMRLGEFPEARALYEQALAAQERVLGPDHPEYAESLSNLANALMETGHYADARPLQERALAIVERALGPDHSRVSRVRADLASVLEGLGDLAGAERLLQTVAADQERVRGPYDTDLGRTLNRLAGVETERGEYSAAESHFRRARAILRKAYGPGHPDEAVSLDGLGRLRHLTGRDRPAVDYFRAALEVRRSRLGATHPAVAEELNRLAEVHWSLGEARQAFEESLRAEEILRAHFGHSLRGLSEREALDYERVRASGLSTALSVLAGTPPARLPTDAVERVWVALVRSRALVLDQMAGLHRAAGDRDDPALARVFGDLVAVTNREAALLVRGPEPAHPEGYLSDLEGATREKEALERRLAGASASFRARMQQDPSTFEGLRRSVPAAAALVAYTLYERSRPRAPSPGETAGPRPPVEPSYIAFVLGANRGGPAAVQIGSAREIDRIIERWRTRSAVPPAPLEVRPADRDRELRVLGETLRSKIWDPVGRVLGSAERVLVVPDGALNLVNLATLPVGQEKYQVESGPTFHYLSAERDLLALAEAPPRSGRGALILGGPDFDARPETLQAPSDASLNRGPAASCAGFRAMHFDPLPASTREVEEIRTVIVKQGATSGLAASDVLELTEAKASESAFKSLAPGRRILHLATHAFLLENDCASSLGPASRPSPPAGTTGDRPLLLSGLAVAGANRRGDVAVGAEDGILTAEEIATLDLSGVQWAVLSACESGLGPIQTGEGMLGLRRAFAVAGARTLITSLWKVDDESTTEWMRHLYEGRLSGMTTAESVRHASLVMLRARRRAGRSTNPFFWGAFAAAGDWR